MDSHEIVVGATHRVMTRHNYPAKQGMTPTDRTRGKTCTVVDVLDDGVLIEFMVWPQQMTPSGHERTLANIVLQRLGRRKAPMCEHYVEPGAARSDASGHGRSCPPTA